MGGIARFRALTATGLIYACIFALFGFVGAALARPSRALRPVHYHGLSVRVPRSWPVFDLARDPQTCVRFNRHALYLGTPGRQERCPAHAVGRTDAILISPLHVSRGAPSATAGGLNLDGDVSSYSLHAAGVDVTATWSRSPQTVAQALGRRSLPGRNGRPASASTSAAPDLTDSADGLPGRSSFRASVYTGLGFDTCMAPSASQLAAWSASPYHAVGI